MSPSLYDLRNPGVSATVNAGLMVLPLSREAPMGIRCGGGDDRDVATEVPCDHAIVVADAAPGGEQSRHQALPMPQVHAQDS